MPHETKYDGDDSNPVDLQRFIENAKTMARMNGACVFEFFTCPNPECAFQQAVTHPFREVVPCAKCGQRMASRVPRLELPGEVTKLMLEQAIYLVRQAYPQPCDATREWLEKQEGPIKAVALAWACVEVNKALNSIQTFARAMTGAHS